MEQVLEIHKSADIVTLTLNRPQALNALNADVFTALNAFFTEDYKALLPFHGVIITGTGPKAFAAGADIAEFSSYNSEQGAGLAARGKDVFFRIERFAYPVIAAINGFALGGGCELAMACHLRVASASARFGQPEVNLGLIPGYGGTQRLVHLVGKSRALELLITGDMIDAQTALQYGLVNKVVEEDQLISACEELLGKIGRKGPLAVRDVIAAVNACFEDGVDGYQKETALFGGLMDTEDFVEGTSAFLEKRKPAFKRS